jgi:membrane-associated phospholipid phosphatase
VAITDSARDDTTGRRRDELLALDAAIYQAVASTPTPRLDEVLRPLTSAADHSKLWLATAAVLALAGGEKGRQAALDGVLSIGLASASVNQGAKHLNRRPRPDRDTAQVPTDRRVSMPTSTSFPSGHTASAFAFAGGVARTMPWLGSALRLAATTVGYTRVHAGVHYPGDVVAGALIGIGCGEIAPRVGRRAQARARTWRSAR